MNTGARHGVIPATLSTADGLTFQKHGQSLDRMPGAGSELSPVEYLLLSAAGCQALSLKAAALDAGTAAQSIVTAFGTKSSATPNRLNHVERQALGVPELARDEADALLGAAPQR